MRVWYRDADQTRRSSPIACAASDPHLIHGCASGASTHRGKIVVKATSNYNVLGYIRKTFDGQNSYTHGTLTNALTVQLPSTDSTYLDGLIEIMAVDGPDSSYPLLGAVG